MDYLAVIAQETGLYVGKLTEETARVVHLTYLTTYSNNGPNGYTLSPSVIPVDLLDAEQGLGEIMHTINRNVAGIITKVPWNSNHRIVTMFKEYWDLE